MFYIDVVVPIQVVGRRLIHTSGLATVGKAVQKSKACELSSFLLADFNA